MSAISQAAKNYRVLLKHVKALPSAENWKGRVVEQYKLGRSITDPSLAEHQRSIASQYVTMISSIKEISHLRGLDYGEKLDPRDKIRATASRVGLSVPRFADDAFDVPLNSEVSKEQSQENIVKNSG